MIKLISIIGFFITIYICTGFNIYIFIDIPSLIAVIFGTLFLTGIKYKKNYYKIDILKTIKKNVIIIGILISFMSTLLIVVDDIDKVLNNLGPYVGLSVLPMFYGFLIMIIIDIMISNELNKNKIQKELKNCALNNKNIVKNLNQNSNEQIEKEQDDSEIKKLNLELTKYEKLTNREKEILELIKNGMDNKEIAKHIFISENTVKKHVGNILSKFEVKNRIELISKLNQE
ncbi:LuxR C-terminal-related transcriptional regulator [Peptostreptococcaceae bacterium AGR-M142]